MTRTIVLIILLVLVTLILLVIAAISKHPATGEGAINCYNAQGYLIGNTPEECEQFYQSELHRLKE